MYYYIWIAINALFILGSAIYIWTVQPHDNFLIVVGKSFAQIALFFFIFNVNLHFVIKIIRKTRKRNLAILLATIIRKLMKGHVAFAIIGTTLIIIHSGLMMRQLGPVIGYDHLKMITGYISILMLVVTLFGGYRRRRKATGFRRRFHIVTALTFGAAFTIHLFYPVSLP